MTSTPNGFSRASGGNPLRAAARGLGQGAGWGLRRLGKLVATVWRIAGALDSALWRGFLLIAAALFRGGLAIRRAIWGGVEDFVAWLPSRAGVAYCAASGVVLMISALWIVDEVRFGASVAVRGEADDANGGDRPPIDREDPVVARADGRFVHLSDVAATARAAGALDRDEDLTVEAAFARGFVEDYVEQRLLAKAAIRDGAHRAPAVAQRLQAARDRILAAAFIERAVEDRVTPEAVQALFNAQADVTRLGDEVSARHIVVETREDAAVVESALRGGADFAELARAVSLDDATAPLGGAIGYFTRDMMATELARAAFSTPTGRLAPAFQSEFGWHVLEVLDRRPTAPVRFDAAADGIRRFLADRTITDLLTAIAEEDGVVYYRPRAAATRGAGARDPGAISLSGPGTDPAARPIAPSPVMDFAPASAPTPETEDGARDP